MNITFLRIATIAIVLMGSCLSSCTSDFEVEAALTETATRSVEDNNVDVDFYYLRNEKIYLNICRDNVIIKKSSDIEAESFCKQNSSLPGAKIDNMGKWVFSSTDVINSRLKSQESLNSTYGLEYDGLMRWPTDQIFIQCIRGESPQNVLGKVGLTENVEEIELFNPYFDIYLITLDVELGDILRISRDIYETGLCEFAEPSFIREIRPTNEHYHRQWSFNNTGQYGTSGIDIKAEQAWAITRGNPNIKVAVLDDGVDLTHPDLQANLLSGYDAAAAAPGGINGGPWIGDIPNSQKNTHGTSCAGIIGAVNNNIGVVGIASGCKIIPVRIAWGEAGYPYWRISDPGFARGGNVAYFLLGALL